MKKMMPKEIRQEFSVIPGGSKSNPSKGTPKQSTPHKSSPSKNGVGNPLTSPWNVYCVLYTAYCVVCTAAFFLMVLFLMAFFVMVVLPYGVLPNANSS